MKTNEEIQLLQKSTIGQSSCQLWKQERVNRVTASNFGRICKIKKSTLCEKLVISLLYKQFHGSKATEYGIQNEPFAVKQFEDETGLSVVQCGLQVSAKFPYLGASPDGLVGDNAIIEIKCPYKARNLEPVTAACSKDKIERIDYVKIIDGALKLNKQHNYYFQIQGQLEITKRSLCYFIIWTLKGLSIEKVELLIFP